MEQPAVVTVPEEEIYHRISSLQRRLKEAGLHGCLILERVNLFYYTGTIQNGTLYVPASGEPVLFIRRSFERGSQESPLRVIRKYKRFKDILPDLADRDLSMLGIDETTTPVRLFSMIEEAFPATSFEDIGIVLSEIRAVKSAYEIAQIREAGRRHALLYERIPDFISEGMTEWELGSRIVAAMCDLGFTGFLRLAGFNSEAFCGNICFGESGNAPCAFEGPGGLAGQSPAFPLLGSHRTLHKGDIISIDTGFGYNGYYTDTTRIFSLGTPRPEVMNAHHVCLMLQEEIRRMLRPGVRPSEIYEAIYNESVYMKDFAEGFMGFEGNQVPFLGHGIGLVIDEFPPIAKKIDYPLQENMAIAVEPKKGLAGIGLVGIENTYVVTPGGGERVTQVTDEIMVL